MNSLITTPFAGSLTGHNDSVRELAFSRDGRTLATGSRDNRVILWDMASHRQVWPPAHRAHRPGVVGGVLTRQSHSGHRQQR